MNIGRYAFGDPRAPLHRRGVVIVGVERLAAVDAPFDLVRQGFVRLVAVGEQRVAARARHLERIEHRGHGRPLLVALVGVEVHLAVRQGADRLAVLADVRDQHDGGVTAHELLGVDHGRRPEHFREADLILLAQLLIAQQDHEMLVPGVPDLRADVFIDRPCSDRRR